MMFGLLSSSFGFGVVHGQSADDLARESVRLADEGLLLLEGPFVGPVGSQAVYIVTFEEYVELFDPENRFDGGSFEAHQEVSALAVQYTVLDPHPDTGATRLRVRAYAVDPHSYVPLGGDGWEAIYRMENGEFVPLAGATAPGDYEAFVRPDWLVHWSMSREGDFPRGPVAAGNVWSSAGVHPLSDADGRNVPVDIVGTFVEWTFVDEFGSLAHVLEYGRGEGPFPGSVNPSWIPLGDAEFYQERNYVFVPGYFPGYVQQWIEVEGAFQTGPDAGSIRGALIGFVVEYDLDASGFFPWPPDFDSAMVEYPVLQRGIPATGVLGSTGETLTDGSYVDTYTFRGEAGEEIVLRLESDDFDPYLFLLDDEEQQLATDDDSAGNLNALLRYTLPYSGTYHVWVNSWSPDEQGAYTVYLDTAEPFSADAYPPLTFNERIEGTLDAHSESWDDGSFADGYRFTGMANETVEAVMTSDDFDAYLILLDDTGEWVAFDDDSDGDLNPRLRQRLPYTGTYVLVATSWEPGAVGDYTLRLQRAHPVDMDGYAHLEPSVPATGMLGAWSDVYDDGTYVDRYRFVGAAGDRIALGVQSSDFDSYLFLLDDTGHVLASDDDSGGGGDALLRYELPYDGEYAVFVNTFSEGERGMYTLRLESLGPFDVNEALAVIALLNDPEGLTRADLTRIEWSLDDLWELFLDAWMYVAD